MNHSGLYPKGNRVLVKPDAIEEKTEGGIIVPPSVKDRHQMSTCYGVVVAMGADCYIHTVHTTKRLIDGHWKVVERKVVGYSEPFCAVGDRIVYSMYVGRTYDGKDGVSYKLINDDDVISQADEGVVQTSIESRKAM